MNDGNSTKKIIKGGLPTCCVETTIQNKYTNKIKSTIDNCRRMFYNPKSRDKWGLGDDDGVCDRKTSRRVTSTDRLRCISRKQGIMWAHL